MKNLLSVIMVCFLLLSCGCAAVLIGGGIVGGMAISKDSAEIVKDTNYDKAWKVTRKTLDEMGAINLEDKKAGKIEANVKDTKITANVTQLTDKTVKIVIKARKNLMPNVDQAVEVITKIDERL